MVTPPTLREAAASGGTFPRWGYLDKFYVNEYMARALLAAMLLGFGGLGAWRVGSSSRPRERLVRLHPISAPIEASRF